jgi:hypothetical protein
MARQKAARVPVAKTYKLYVDGKFPRSESGRYYPLQRAKGPVVANVCRASRKDFRDAVVAARGALAAWAGSSPYLRGRCCTAPRRCSRAGPRSSRPSWCCRVSQRPVPRPR